MGRLASQPVSKASAVKPEEASFNRAHLSAYDTAWASEIAVNLKFSLRWVDTERLTEALLINFTHDQLCTLVSKSLCSTFAKRLNADPQSAKHDQQWLIEALRTS